MSVFADRLFTPVKSRVSIKALVEALGLVCVLLLAGYVRLTELETNPGWYSDEGTLIDIAQHLLQGRWQYMAINQSTLLVARLPVFPLLLSLVFRMFGPGIVSLRLLTGFLGVISVGLVYLLVRRADIKGNFGLPLLAAFLLAIYPEAVLRSRLGFSYNLLAVFALLACIGLYSYLSTERRAWLVLVALSIGLGIVTDLMMITFILPAVLIISLRGWRNLVWVLLLMAVPGVLYVTWMMVTVPGAFLFDAQFTLSRLGTMSGLVQLPAVLFNYYALINRDPWALLGVIGLFLVRPFRWRGVLLLLVFIPLVSLGRTTLYGAGLGAYYIIALLPFFTIGMSSLIWAAGSRVLHTIERGLTGLLSRWGWHESWNKWWRSRIIALTSGLALFLIVLSPLLVSTAVYFVNGISSWSAPVEPVLVDAQDARSTLDYINARVDPDDLVVASPAVAWGIRSNTADFQQTLIADGIATIHFPDNVPADRFEFNPRYQGSRYVVVDRIWRNWAALNMPEVAAMMENVESWPLVYSSGEVQVYENPDR